MSDFCPVYDWDYSKMVPVVHYNCIPLIYWLPWFFAGVAVGLVPFIVSKIRVKMAKPEEKP